MRETETGRVRETETGRETDTWREREKKVCVRAAPPTWPGRFSTPNSACRPRRRRVKPCPVVEVLPLALELVLVLVIVLLFLLLLLLLFLLLLLLLGAPARAAWLGVSGWATGEQGGPWRGPASEPVGKASS